MVNGKPILELFEPRTYTASCRTLRNALLVDSINLRKTMRIQGWTWSARTDSYLYSHSAFHNDDGTQRKPGKHYLSHNTTASRLDRTGMVARYLL
ncbi:hypothetical protein TNCV_58981 [Trichonephila clavipes]|nr:hypothetical protein TNCV_58981 [Trichonephila clavipes]